MERMMSYRINDTTKPIEYKTWTIGIKEVTENHLKFLKGYNITARAVVDSQVLTASNGRQYRYGASGTAEFETTNKDQEAMLRLLYGDKLMLLMVDVVLPNTYSTCVLDRINFDSI
jgi:hypothetical protein